MRSAGLLLGIDGESYKGPAPDRKSARGRPLVPYRDNVKVRVALVPSWMSRM